ncbi:MAG: glycoside hydrolase family 57 protein [Bacteroidales bacterium]|nr:glycoside hydrolase family 57 protein [Bacteroidales bacterium]MDD2424885.1 glycoside hydrolase family 57 protein [Bacteroidales bacterium]MDD3989730.1 glycoside hydrolase family 57 protein [Bacteroidales bacterium]
MKKSICLYFQVHQPDRLRTYRFFDIGTGTDYYDDFTNRTILRRVADRCYLPANNLMLELIKEHRGEFRISYSVSGVVMEQFERYMPEVIESFKELAGTGCVEFLAETYSHSLSSLISSEEFSRQVREHSEMTERLFGQKPVTFRNTELIYSDKIGESVYGMGFKTMLTEGAKHILGWKSPNYVYTNAINPRLKLLLRNSSLSDDIAFRFSERSWPHWPLTAEKFVTWIAEALVKEDIVNIFMDYETFGEHQQESTGIFGFLRHLPQAVLSRTGFSFVTPSQATSIHQPVAPLHVPYAISWADEERDTTAWLGNELQNEAFNKLYSAEESVKNLNNPSLTSDFRKLQESDHLYYMCTKFFSDGAVHNYFNPYDSPYDAFINYMNVISDFLLRIQRETDSQGEKSGTVIAEVTTPAKKKSKKQATTKKIATIATKDARSTAQSGGKSKRNH